MTKLLADAAHDAKLNFVSTNGTEGHVCTGDPADRAAAIAASVGTWTPTYQPVAAGGAGVRRTLQIDDSGPIVTTGAGLIEHVCILSATELVAKHPDPSPSTVSSGETISVDPFNIDSLDET